MDPSPQQLPLIECVPNFSEGRDAETIAALAQAVASVEGVYLLHQDAGPDANRTVLTFVGPPEAVIDAAFRAIQVAARCIDMRRQQGAHPRLGATDVCPLIPLQHMSTHALLPYAERLAQRVAQQLQIPVYLYEQSARAAHRTRLEQIRQGEYEGLAARMLQPGWQPDYGPTQPNLQAGATVIGVRDFLIAYNINLDTQDVAIAREIAGRIRQSGTQRLGPDGTRLHVPGLLAHVKAIGWYMEAYGCAQVSTNLTRYAATPLHRVYEAVSHLAQELGTRVTGSELIGLIPKQALLDTGYYLLHQDAEPTQVDESLVIDKAVRTLNLNTPTPVEPQARRLEYALARARQQHTGKG
ncbi:MAG: glutamate formimidoyltransferase [Sphingobacteriia bacterium]